MPKCCVPNCQIQKAPFHRFPKFEEVYNVWLARISRPNINNINPLQNECRVCSGHFADFNRYIQVHANRIRLKLYSVPCINVPGFDGEPTYENAFHFPSTWKNAKKPPENEVLPITDPQENTETVTPIIIYGNVLSPPVRSVLMVAKTLGIKYRFMEVNFLKGLHFKHPYLQTNPQHTIPTIDDNGFILWDSQAICAYFVNEYGQNDILYPKDSKKRAIVDQRLHFNSSILYPRFRNICYPCLFSDKNEISKSDERAIIEAYEFLEKFLSNNDWLAGEQMTIADFCAISNITTISPIITIDYERFPKLVTWINKCEEIPVYNVNIIGAHELSARIKKCLGRDR